MSWLLLLEGVLIGILYFTSGFTLILWKKDIDKAVNLAYTFFGVCIGTSLLFATKNYFNNDLTTYISNYKIYSSFLISGGLFYLLVVAFITDYINKKFLVFNFLLVFIVLFVNVLRPYGIAFEIIYGQKTQTIFWGEDIFLPLGDLSPTIVLALIFVISSIIYLLLALRKVYKSGDVLFTKVLILTLFLGIFGVLIDIILLMFDYRTLALADELSFISFGVLVGFTNLRKVLASVKIKRELVQSENKYRLLAENVSDVIWTIDTTCKISYISNSAQKLLGIKVENYIGEELSLILDEKSYNDFRSAFVEPLKSNKFDNAKHSKIYKFEAKLKKYDGSHIWADIAAHLLIDEHSGNLLGVIAVARDISDKKLIEQQLVETTKLLDAAITQSSSGIIIADAPNVKVRYVNKAAREIRGESDSHNNYVHPKNWKAFFIDGITEYPQDKLPLSRAILNGDSVLNEELFIARDNGEKRLVSASAGPIKDELGNVVSGMVIFQDITEKRNMQQTIIQSEKLSSIAGLAAGMAHEINNPLGTIVQGCQNLNRRLSPELNKNLQTAEKLGVNFSAMNLYFNERQVYGIIDSMKNAADRASRIIGNMLQFSRKHETSKEPYSISKLINDSIELLYNDYNLKKNMDLRTINIVVSDFENLPNIIVNVNQIQQVVFNLIKNAVQALNKENDPDKKPEIKIKAYKNINYVLVEIEDNGPGIPKNVRNRVFEPFFTTKDVGEGTGLGLSVVHTILTKNHNGNIRFETEEGKGTKFILSLPIGNENGEFH